MRLALTCSALLIALPAWGRAQTEADVSRMIQQTWDSVYKVAEARSPSIVRTQIVVDRAFTASMVQKYVNKAFYQDQPTFLPRLGTFDYPKLASCELASVGRTCRQDGLSYLKLDFFQPIHNGLRLTGMFQVPTGSRAGAAELSHDPALFIFFQAIFVQIDGSWVLDRMDMRDGPHSMIKINK